jgi:hypothetical protein
MATDGTYDPERGNRGMSIKPQNGRRNYAKGGAVKRGYLAGGTIWPDSSSPYAESLPVSGGSANLPGGTMQTGGPGVYDPEHPERGAQGWSTLYQPAEVPATEGAIGELGHMSFAPKGTHKFKYKV